MSGSLSVTARDHRWHHQDFTIRKPLGLIALGLTIALTATNVALLKQVQRLDRVIAGRVRSLQLKVGSRMPPLEGLTLDGKPLSIRYDGQRRMTLLLVFSPTCPLCTLNWPTWQALANAIDRTKYRLVFANNTSNSLAQAFLTEHHLTGEIVLSKVDPKSSVVYEMNLTPSAALIDQTGQVRSVWPGMMKGAGLKDMETALDIPIDVVAASLGR